MPSFVADFHLDTGQLPLGAKFNNITSDSILALPRIQIDAYDVNVSPDKRSIFLHSEQNLIEALKVSSCSPEFPDAEVL